MGDDFWESTSDELAVRFEGIAKRDAAQYEMFTFLAWRMALWSRVKDFPSWESVRPTRKEHKQTPSDHGQMLRVLSEQYGIPLRSRAGKNSAPVETKSETKKGRKR